jgi:hypothetical protein
MKKKFFLLFILCIPIYAQKITPKKSYNLIMGYNVNYPDQLVGFNIIITSTSKIGFFIGFRSGHVKEWKDDEFDLFYKDITINDAKTLDHTFIDDAKFSSSIEFGWLHYISNHIFFQYGIGFIITKYYNQYYDFKKLLSSNGFYWIKDNPFKEKKLSVLGGIGYSNNGSLITIGFSTYPFGLIIGLGIDILPLFLR